MGSKFKNNIIQGDLMRLNKLSLLILNVVIASVSTSVQARTWFELGAEYESYSDKTDEGATYNYERLNALAPYVRFSHTPVNNEWNVWGKAFVKTYENEDMYPDGKSTGQTDRVEMYYTKMIRKGNWRFRPGIGFRHNGYESDRFETEYRFLPQADYFISSNSQLFLSGHGYIGDAKGKRMSDKSEKDYTDWGYEAEFGWLYRFDSGDVIKPHLFTEYDSFENNYDVELWQLRLTYTKKIGRASITPFIRYGLGREIVDRSHVDPERWGLSRDNNYHRAGVYGNVGISGKWNVVYEAYYQIEELHGTYGEDLPDRDKSFVKLGIQRIF